MTEPTDRPDLRVVRGDPSAEELAVLTALVATRAAGGRAQSHPVPRRGRWNDPAAQVRRQWLPGPGGWLSAGRGG